MNLQIGTNIKKLRTQRALTQDTLAARLGVAPQSISKWERGEGYPDITFLIPLAEYFGVSLDDLMGREEEMREQQIVETIGMIEDYRHSGDHAAENELIRRAYAEFPFDFRIVTKYIDSLLDSENMDSVREEVEKLCKYVMDECTTDELRYDAITSMIRLYSSLGEYDRAVECTNRLPGIFYTKELQMTCIYPEGDERDYMAMANFVDKTMEHILWEMYCIAVNRKNITAEERIDILKRILTVADAVYPDFDYGICHSGLADTCLSLFRLYSEAGDAESALRYLERGLRHEKELDDCNDEVIVHTSLPLRGSVYDMRKTWSGCRESGVAFMLNRLNKAPFCFELYCGDERYRRIIEAYHPFA